MLPTENAAIYGVLCFHVINTVVRPETEPGRRTIQPWPPNRNRGGLSLPLTKQISVS